MTSELPIDPAVFPEKKYISTFSSGRRELGSVFHMMCYRYDQFLPPSRPQSTNHIPHPPWPQLATMVRAESGHDYSNWLVPSGSRKGGVVAKTRKCDFLDPFFPFTSYRVRFHKWNSDFVFQCGYHQPWEFFMPLINVQSCCTDYQPVPLMMSATHVVDGRGRGNKVTL